MNNLNHLLPSFIPFLAESLATYGLSSTDLVINTFLQAVRIWSNKHLGYPEDFPDPKSLVQ
jgi:hypothetical protein